MDHQIKKILQDRKREEEKVSIQSSTRKKAVLVHREKATGENTGIEGCGYKRNYLKGLNIIVNSYMKETRGTSREK